MSDFVNRIESIKSRLNKLPKEKQNEILSKADRKADSEIKDLWFEVKNYLCK